MALPQSLPAPAEHRAPSPPPADDAADLVARHFHAITILIAGVQLRRINRMYAAFRGDLLQAIVLGEVAMHHWQSVLAGAAPGGGAAVPACSRPDLARASGVPRETLRRAVKRLLDDGWLQQPAARTVALTERARAFFGADYHHTMVDDLLWTADRIRELLDTPDRAQQRAQLRRDLMTALNTRTEDQAEPIFSSQFAPPPDYGRQLGAQWVAAILALTEYWLSHLKRLQVAFDGDLVQPLLLGEIAHYNVASLAYRREVGLATLDALFIDGDPQLVMAILRPCNAHSLSMVTGVPDSSVRRKLAALEARGWLGQTRGGYVVTEAPAQHFRAFNEVSLRSLLDVEQRLRRLLPAPAQAA